MNWDAFEVVNVSKGPIAVTFAKSGISFSQAAVNAVGRPKNVILMLDKANKRMALKTTDDDNENAINFYKPNKKNISVRWNYSELNKSIENLMNWDVQNKTYKVMGEALDDSGALLFDLKSFEVVTRK